MSDEPVGLGVVGCGFTGEMAVKNSAVVSRLTPVAIADPDEDRRQRVADEYSVQRTYRDYREVLDDDEVGAVYLGVPPDIRLPMVLDSFAAGKHVLVQKPHATNAGQILEMDAAASKAGKTLQFSYFLRHQMANRRTRAAVQKGKMRPRLPRPHLQQDHEPASDE